MQQRLHYADINHVFYSLIYKDLHVTRVVKKSSLTIFEEKKTSLERAHKSVLKSRVFFKL
jgi:hypothetical protein